MKVLQIYKDFYPPVVGGIEGHINILANGLRRNGIDVRVLVSNTNSKMEISTYNGIEICKVPEWGRIASAPINPDLPLIMKKLSSDVDLLHFHLPNPTSVLSFLMSGIKKPVIATYHSDIVRQEKLYYLYKPFEKAFFRRLNKIIATSPKYLETSKVLSGFKQKSTIIPLGISTERFNCCDSNVVDCVKAKFNPPLILFIGKFRYYKGLHILIDAMQYVNATLLIIGDGDKKLQKKYLCNANIEKIKFLGELSDQELDVYLNACDILVLPSVLRSEAFGIVLLEAMACGKAVISTELGTGTSYVNLNGETGHVISPNSSYEMSKAINILLQNDNLREKFRCKWEKKGK